VKLLQFYGTPLPSSNSNTSQGGDSGQSNAKEAKNGIENIGLAIFKEDTLVGKLNNIETMCHLIVTNELKNCNISIPDPEDENKMIDLYFTLNTPTKINVNIINGTPYVEVNVKLNSRISSIDELFEELTNEKITKIEKAAENYLNEQISSYLYKTAKEFGSDISGIGKYALTTFKTSSEFKDYNWLDKYTNCFFKVHCTANIKSAFLLSGS